MKCEVLAPELPEPTEAEIQRCVDVLKRLVTSRGTEGWFLIHETQKLTEAGLILEELLRYPIRLLLD